MHLVRWHPLRHRQRCDLTQRRCRGEHAHHHRRHGSRALGFGYVYARQRVQDRRTPRHGGGQLHQGSIHQDREPRRRLPPMAVAEWKSVLCECSLSFCPAISFFELGADPERLFFFCVGRGESLGYYNLLGSAHACSIVLQLGNFVYAPYMHV